MIQYPCFTIHVNLNMKLHKAYTVYLFCTLLEANPTSSWINNVRDSKYVQPCLGNEQPKKYVENIRYADEHYLSQYRNIITISCNYWTFTAKLS